MSEPKRALVTGATGSLGAALCEALLERGWEVTGLRREGSDTDGVPAGVEWAVADVLDADRLDRVVADGGYDYVFHLAGIGLMAADEATVRRVNAEGTRNVFEASLDAGVDRVVFTSTAGTRRHPSRPATEADLAPPLGAYQESKALAEELADTYVDRGLDVVTTHPTSVFGPGDETFTARLLKLALDPKMVVNLPGGASFVSIDDAVDGIVAAAERGTPGESYILGGENLTYDEAVGIIARRGGGRRPPVEVPAAAIRAAGPFVAVVNAVVGTRMFPVNTQMARLATQPLFYDSTKAEKELGYEYQPFEAYVDDAIAWYDETGGTN